MLLSSLNRLRLYCAGEGEDPLANSLKNNRGLSMWLGSISSAVENFLKRKIAIDSYTEFFDIKSSKVEYWINAYPMYSLVDCYEEPRALWNGYEREIQYTVPGQVKGSIITPFAFSYVMPRSLRLRYLGGLAYDAVLSKYSLSSVTGTWVVGKFVRGNSSGAIGYVNAFTSTTLMIEVYYGIFQPGEVVSQYDNEPLVTGSPSVYSTINLLPHFGFYGWSGLWVANKYIKGRLSGAIASIDSLSGTPTSSLNCTMVSGTMLEGEIVDEYDDVACINLTSGTGMTTNTFGCISFINHRALCEVAPDLVIATEMQIRYMRKHALDFENAGTNKDGTTMRKSFRGVTDMLIDEVQAKLQPYKCVWDY